MTHIQRSTVTITGAGNATVVINDRPSSAVEIRVPGPQGPTGAPGASFNFELITLSQEQIDAKQIELDTAPSDPSAVVLIPEGGIAQLAGIDFVVSGNILSWDQLGLDGFLDSGETVIIQF